MNERIRELVKQAGGEFWQRLENDVVNPEAFVTFDPPQSLEKFAELIVRECLTFVEPMPGSGDIDDLALEAAREGIKQHFGVEE